MDEELFFKKLYLWLTGDRSKPWGWPENTKKSLNIVLDLIHYKDTDIREEQRKLIQSDDLAELLYTYYVLGNIDLLRELSLFKSDNDIVTGFCCLLLAIETEDEIWYKRAIKRSLGFARNEYGLYLQTKGENNTRAFALFNEAAKQFNDSDGWNNLGWCYQKGIGTKTNHKSAFDCYKKSAKQGNVIGIGNLAYCYKEKIGTYVSYQKAIKWYSKSKQYEEKVTELLQLRSDQHPEWEYIGRIGDSRFYQGNGQTLKNMKLCDCIECRKLRYWREGHWREGHYDLNIKWYKRERHCVFKRKWFQRWKICESRCITTILCFHHLFAGKRIGVLIAKILWKNRDEK